MLTITKSDKAYIYKADASSGPAQPVAKYTVTFNSNGGSAVTSLAEVESGSKITAPTQSPTKDGYTFAGWYKDAAHNNLWNFATDTVTGNITLYAKWDVVPYTINYVDAGIHINKTSYNIESETFTLSNPTNKDGYTFAGWYSDIGLTIAAQTTITQGAFGEKTFYAKWNVVPYAITYVDAGTHSNKTSYNIETETFTLSNPTKDGYTFVGWYSNAGLTTDATTTVTQGTFGNMTFYAKWFDNREGTAVSTAEELKNIPLTGKYYLVNDIDLGGVEWTPIGSGSGANAFSGTFDGNGYTISNFRITTGREHNGLFGYNTGTITNLGVTDFTVNYSRSGTTNAGGLVGYNSNRGTITNSYATGNVTATASSNAFAGGLAGYNTGTIANSYAVGAVTATASSSSAYVGGLAGINNSGTITNSYATGNVTATASTTSTSASSSTYAGGLVGNNSYYSTITNSYATGNVAATSSSTSLSTLSSWSAYAGGLAGYNESYSTIINSYATGAVSATSSSFAYAGGLAGYNSDTITNCYATGDVTAISSLYNVRAGGLVGKNGGEIANSYATGDVTVTTTTSSNAYAGGLVGDNSYNTITNSYATGDVTAISTTSSNAYAGGLVGDGGAITNSYRYSGQTVEGDITNNLGTSTSTANLQSESFLTGTLLWRKFVSLGDVAVNTSNVWIFASGAYPALYYQLTLI